MTIKYIYPLATIAILAATSASAATVTVDFDSGLLSGGIYTEDGFTFTSDSSGGAGLANNCPTGSPNSSCLQFNNNEIITVTYSGGAFDVDGFLFNAPGNGGDLIAGGMTITETQNGNAMTAQTYTNEFDGVFSFTFQNAANGTGRVDNIVFTVADVPVPAAGLLLLSGLGAIALRRRKSKTA
jgi:hypothetical protein